MPVKTDRRSYTVTYTFSTTSWTQYTGVRRNTGVDQLSIQVQSTCANYNSATISAILQGCLVDDSTEGSSPTESSGWVDIETITFTANGFNRFGGSDYLSGVGPFQWWRVKGSVSGSPSANVTLSVLSQGDYEDGGE